MRWPERETVADETRRVELATMQKLVRYWGTEYSFRRFGARVDEHRDFVGSSLLGQHARLLRRRGRHGCRLR